MSKDARRMTVAELKYYLQSDVGIPASEQNQGVRVDMGNHISTLS
jgi:hypothetical protein